MCCAGMALIKSVAVGHVVKRVCKKTLNGMAGGQNDQILKDIEFGSIPISSSLAGVDVRTAVYVD